MGLDVVLEKLAKYKELTGSDVFNASKLLIELAESGKKLTDAPSLEGRKERLSFGKSSVANNF
jgi:hypothetical protein